MIGLASLRWILSAAFALTSGYHLARCLRPGHLAAPATENWISS